MNMTYRGCGGVDLPDRDAGVVHVTRISIADAPIAEFIDTLSSDERERAARFANAQDRDQFVAVRGWLRRLLGDYLQRAPEQIRFEYGPQGKPALLSGDNSEDLRFNVSHSADVGVLAFSRGREVGVDVELLEPGIDIHSLARSSFSSSENESMRMCASDEQLRRFFQLWTAKEAYVKACGGGLSIPLRDFSVVVRDDRDTWAVEPADDVRAPFFVRRLDLGNDYVGAVAAIGGDCTGSGPPPS